jgi:transcriptional regulator with XRE-family HTH domain
MTTEVAFGKILREVRLKSGLSQERLAFDSGHHRTYISLLERGRRSPTLTTLLRLAAALGVSGSEMVERVEVMVARVGHRRCQ